MISELFKALQAGQVLSNPAKWKRGQELTNLVGIIISGALELLRYFYPNAIIPEGIAEHITEGVVLILVVANIYLTRATTKKDITKAFAEAADAESRKFI